MAFPTPFIISFKHVSLTFFREWLFGSKKTHNFIQSLDFIRIKFIFLEILLELARIM